jgi:RNA polymerase sigma-70 factor (ECF subfamily)
VVLEEAVVVTEAVSVGDDELFERIYPSLRRWAGAVADADLDPDDLVQEAVARALRASPLTDLDDPTAYLRRTILNVAANHRRSRARFRRAVLRLGRTDDTRASEYASDLADLLRVAPGARAVLYLVEVEGRTYAEAAEAIGISEEAARARAARARRQLRIDIEGEQ